MLTVKMIAARLATGHRIPTKWTEAKPLPLPLLCLVLAVQNAPIPPY